MIPEAPTRNKMPNGGRSPATRILLRLCAATLFSMSVWFSATAVAPNLAREWQLAPGETVWLTMAVQVGFVVGTLISALLTLADRIEARKLFATCALAAAVTNGLVALADGLNAALPLRFLTGALMAGIYPPGMKLASTWFRAKRGLAVGALIGAITLGSATPHLFGTFSFLEPGQELPWQITVLGASLLCALGGLIVRLGVEQGPYAGQMSRFDPKAAGAILRQRSLQLTNLGYLGHMWELYAMWTWTPAFLLEIFTEDYGAYGVPLAAAASFAVIAIGGPGSVAAGYLADRIGRTTVIMISLAVSGICCLLAGFVGGVSAPAAVVLFLIWGFAVVADSAQFSTMVTELAPRQLVGTALTIQTSLGFLLTTVSLQALPLIRSSSGWSEAFAILALGPAVGIIAMVKLRRSPEYTG